MGSRRIVVVVNPRSQNGALGRRWSQIAWQLRKVLGPFDDVLTRQPGDATQLARQAIRDGAGQIVAIGGDGTINEVSNGFFADGEPIETDATFGILPFGTGGDFRKTVKIPRELSSAARVLKRGKARRIDMGRVDFTTPQGEPATRMFINITSFGISGLVDEHVNSSSKMLGGTLSFLLATAVAELQYQNQRVRLVYDEDEAGAIEQNVHTVAVANGRYFGGGMFIAPTAEVDDGLFDVVTLGDLGTVDMLLRGHHVYRGTHYDQPKVSHRRARHLRATPLCEEPVRIDVDGEAPGHLPATFSILPKALSLIVPP